MTALSRAAAHDVSFAAAQMRLAFMRSLESLDEGLVRTTFMQAVRNRATLDARDRPCSTRWRPTSRVTPAIRWSRPSASSSCGRADRSTQRLPTCSGACGTTAGDLAAAMEAFDAAIAIDPDFALAWSSKGGCLSYMGRFDEARASLEEAPTVPVPRRNRSGIWPSSTNRKVSATPRRAHVRTWLSRDPEDWYAYHYLAQALAGGRKSADTVLAALEQEWVKLEPSHRAKLEPMDSAFLALATGNFRQAEGLNEVETVLAGEPGAQAHAETNSLLARIAEETGHPERLAPWPRPIWREKTRGPRATASTTYRSSSMPYPR